MEKVVSAPENVLLTSHLALMECKVAPVRNHDELLCEAFDAFFSKAVSELLPLSGAVFERATEIRASYGFATADAIHLAAAIVHGCDAFLTNDVRLSRCPDIPVQAVGP